MLDDISLISDKEEVIEEHVSDVIDDIVQQEMYVFCCL